MTEGDDALVAATLLLVFVTLLLAGVGAMQTQFTRLADRERRREVHVQDIQPLLIHEPALRADKRRVDFDFPVGSRPVLKLVVKIRQVTAQEEPFRSKYAGSFQAGWRVLCAIDVTDFFHDEPGGAKVDPWEVVLSYVGMFGQTVEETYLWHETDEANNYGTRWQLTHIRVDPVGVKGAEAQDVDLGNLS